MQGPASTGKSSSPTIFPRRSAAQRRPGVERARHASAGAGLVHCGRAGGRGPAAAAVAAAGSGSPGRRRARGGRRCRRRRASSRSSRCRCRPPRRPAGERRAGSSATPVRRRARRAGPAPCASWPRTSASCRGACPRRTARTGVSRQSPPIDVDRHRAGRRRGTRERRVERAGPFERGAHEGPLRGPRALRDRERAPAVLLPGRRVVEVVREHAALRVDERSGPRRRQQLVDGGHALHDRGRERRVREADALAVQDRREGRDAPGVGCRHLDQARDAARPGPGRRAASGPGSAPPKRR